MKYDIYLRILDQIISDAPVRYARYHIDGSKPESLNQARARASIHLYLKVAFGLLDFDTREHFITDGSLDGGIDAYYIDSETKVLYLIQAKFRANERNQENKEITLGELLSMDVNRIMEGESKDENGNEYNGKIKQLQREVSELTDIARYSYKVILLANLFGVSSSNLRKLTGGYAVDVFDYRRTYEDLVFPVISGTYFTAGDISIPIDLSSKSAGSKISYTVSTKTSDCEITVLFVPTLELAKVMDKYRNSILKYNPRSYLDLEGKKVNTAIRETILNVQSNEFALYNNGITMLSDETYINEKIGQKNRAQLTIKNPQIINGGQTTYTLSRIYDENRNGNLKHIFGGKEVLLKIITLLDESNDAAKLQLIEDISNATNQQTPVINADRFANESFHKSIQRKVFDRYGLLYERKRGEFSDGIRDGYLQPKQVVERNQFFRIYYAANGHIHLGAQKKLFQKNQFPHFDLSNNGAFDRFYIGFQAFRELFDGRDVIRRFERDIYAKIYVYNQLFKHDDFPVDDETISRNVDRLNDRWYEFLGYARENFKRVDKRTGQPIFVHRQFYPSGRFQDEVVKYFGCEASSS